MPLPLALVAMAALLATIAAFVVATGRVYRGIGGVLRGRGYRSPAVVSLAQAGAAVATLLAVAAAGLVVASDDLLWPALALVLVVPAAVLGIVRLLPRRELRPAGAREIRLPYARLARGLFIGAVGMVGLAALTGSTVLVRMAPLLIIAGLVSLGVARRAALPDAAATRANDPRPPVLYLRPFEHELDVFAEQLRRPGDVVGDWVSAVTRRDSRRFLTLERYLADGITVAIGPFVALGNPGDFVPPPGAARLYAADIDWTRRLDDLVGVARAVVLMAATTARVEWELSHLLAVGAHERLVILTPPTPVAPDGWSVGDLRWRVTRFITRPTDVGPVAPSDWQSFAGALGRAGYTPCPDPGPGAVVGVDAARRTVVVRRDARHAGEVVDALVAWLG